MKNVLLLLMMALPFLLSDVHAYPIRGGAPEPVRIHLTDSPISFPNNPFLLSGEVMAPASPFFAKLGFALSWNESRKELIAYKNNTFIKMKPSANLLYVNGKNIKLPIPLFRIHRNIYIPVNFISRMLNLNSVYHPADKTLTLDFKTPYAEFATFGNESYKKHIFREFGISLYIPETLEKTSESHFSSLIDHASFTLSANITERSVEELAQEIMEQISAESGTLQFHGTTKIGGLTFYEISSTSQEGKQHDRLILLHKGMAFRLHGEDLGKHVLHNIAGTFSIDNVSVNESQEHYVEYALKDILNIEFNQTLFSNMIVNNSVFVSGTAPDSNSIDIFVEKGEKRLSFRFDVVEGKFSGFLYLPFGTGKHNVAVYTDLKEPQKVDELIGNRNRDPGKLVLKLSMINSKANETRYIVPTASINYDFSDLYNHVLSLVYNANAEYIKAIRIAERVNLYPTKESESIRKIDEILRSEEISSFEKLMLYTALTRSLDIPTRIVRGDDEYWCEITLNGKWFRVNFSSQTLEPESKYRLRYDTQTYLNI